MCVCVPELQSCHSVKNGKMYPSSGIVVGAARFPFQTFSPGTCSTICWFKFVNICFHFLPDILSLRDNMEHENPQHSICTISRQAHSFMITLQHDGLGLTKQAHLWTIILLMMRIVRGPSQRTFNLWAFTNPHLKKATQFISQEPDGKKKCLTFGC